MPNEWRMNTLVPIYKEQRRYSYCLNYRRIKLISHTKKLQEKMIEHRLREYQIIIQIYARTVYNKNYLPFTGVDGKVLKGSAEVKKDI